MSFPPATEMFQFAGFASRPYEFRSRYPFRGGLPHSETPGSPIARISPGLFAACRVLHRLSVPRHPPDALLWARSQARQTAPQRGRPSRVTPHRAVRPGSGTPPRTGASPRPRHPARQTGRPGGGRSHEDTSPDRPATGSRLCPRPVRLGHIRKFASPDQSAHPGHQPKRPAARHRAGGPDPGPNPCLLRMPRITGETPENRPDAKDRIRSNLRRLTCVVRPRSSDLRRLTSVVWPVEVNGIEPMTSCLQSRRSPN